MIGLEGKLMALIWSHYSGRKKLNTMLVEPLYLYISNPDELVNVLTEL